MSKVGNFFLNNLRWLFALVVVGATAGVVTSQMMGSYNDYKSYEKAYDANDLAIRSEAAAAPKKIEIVDDFITYSGSQIKTIKSKFSYGYNAWAEDLKVTTSQDAYIVDDYIDLTEKGGTISLEMTVEEKSFLDIAFCISSSMETVVEDETVYGVKDLLSNVSFIINGETMDEEIDLPNDSGDIEWHHLVMSGFALPAGTVKITIKNNSGKNACMPKLRNIALFSSEIMTAVEAE